MSSVSYREAFQLWKDNPVASFPNNTYIRAAAILFLILYGPADFLTTIAVGTLGGAHYEVNPIIRVFLETNNYHLFALFKLIAFFIIWILFTIQFYTRQTRTDTYLLYTFIILANTMYALIITSNLYVLSLIL